MRNSLWSLFKLAIVEQWVERMIGMATCLWATELLDGFANVRAETKTFQLLHHISWYDI